MGAIKDGVGQYSHSVYFENAINHLTKHYEGFRLNTLAKQMDCSTERIRRIRVGLLNINADDVCVLWEFYNVNPLYLLRGELPIVLTEVVKAAPLVSDLERENELLRNSLEDKERVIQLYERHEKPNATS